MLNRIVIYPYSMKSLSAKELQKGIKDQGVECIRVFPDREYKPRATDLIVNWGNGQNAVWTRHRNCDLNHSMAVGRAIHKGICFDYLAEANVPIPEYTTSPEIAQTWIESGYIVLGRSKLNSHSGSGIYIYDKEDKGSSIDQLVYGNAETIKLWVKYIKKIAEYRVHVFSGEVIDVQQKKRKRNFRGEFNNYIRSHNNGWVFARKDTIIPEVCLQEAVKAVKSLGLDFGAVDVIWNNYYQKAYVLEVNTAPGLTGTTLINYITAIKRYF